MFQKKGLTTQEARKRLEQYGKNEIKRKKKISPLKILVSQFVSPIILLLIAAAVLSFVVNFFKDEAYFDSILILIIVLGAGIAGFLQNYKAEKAVEALQKMASPKAKVIRDGKEQEINSVEIVSGDLIIAEGGDIVPADAKVINGKLEVNESLLTGESIAKAKKTGDKIFKNCSVYVGRVVAEVFAVGMKTKIGEIAFKMEEIKESETIFQLHMKKFTRKIVGLTAFIITITFAISFGKFGFLEAALVAVSLAVAAIPEDLPAVITIALSLGAKGMVEKNTLVKKLAITESIGSVDIICTDKTGTLTEGKMKVIDIWAVEKNRIAENLAVKCCYYCNDAKQILKEEEKKWIGDETDIALKQFSLNKIKEEGERIDEIPFSSEREMMTVVQDIGRKVIFSKGAPEVIIRKSGFCLVGEKVVKLNEDLRRKILKENEKFASKGCRVLGLAYKDYVELDEKNLTFVGLIIMEDPSRPEVKEAIAECYLAGVRTVMITGDNPMTAKAIADEVGIKTKSILIGDDLDKMNEKELKKVLGEGVNIFARTTPFHKMRILEILQKKGHIVAMTGDGVNDSLALKKADVGIAMGIKGTEVAKEASDIILLDDNFATIKNAVKEGRKIFDNIRKFVNYLLTCNVAEVIVVLVGTSFFSFVPLYPVQILWINLITDGLPALALSMDPAKPGIMKEKPRKKTEGIVNKKLAILIGGIGIKKALMLLVIFLIILPLGEEKTRTALFTGFIMYEFVRIGVIRYNENLSSLKDWFANKFLVYSLILSFVLQLVLIYSPLNTYFGVVPLGLYEWGVLFGGTIVGFILGIVIVRVVNKAVK